LFFVWKRGTSFSFNKIIWNLVSLSFLGQSFPLCLISYLLVKYWRDLKASSRFPRVWNSSRIIGALMIQRLSIRVCVVFLLLRCNSNDIRPACTLFSIESMIRKGASCIMTDDRDSKILLYRDQVGRVWMKNWRWIWESNHFKTKQEILYSKYF
jgi:hypothetical protein